MPRNVMIRPGVASSSLGLGCAGLFREPTRAARRRLLEVAFDSGIRHFDVAPMYGLGLAERELGRFARGRRDGMCIATKFGIVPSTVGRAAGLIQGPVRFALARLPSASNTARKKAAGPSSGGPGKLIYRSLGYDAVAARNSLERSLRQLSTEYVDLYLLHDPQPGSVRSEELQAFLDQAIVDGKIRAWGVAGETQPTRSVVAELGSGDPVVQVPYDVTAPDDLAATIRFGALGTNLERLQGHLAGPGVSRRWTEAIGRDISRNGALPTLLLRSALFDTQEGVVLYSSTKEARIREAAELASADPASADGELTGFRGLAAEELRAPASP